MTDDKKPPLSLNNPTERQVRKEPEREVRYSRNKTRRKESDEVDDLWIDPKDIPDGFSVEWKRMYIYGQEDKKHLINTEKGGWEPAHPKDFPSLVGKNYTGNYIMGGKSSDLVLMIRPIELTEEAKQEQKSMATGQVRTKMKELGMANEGEAPRRDSAGNSLVKVHQSYERIPVPE